MHTLHRLERAAALLHEVVVTTPSKNVRGYVEYLSTSATYCVVWDGDDPIHIPCDQVTGVWEPGERDGVPVVRRPRSEHYRPTDDKKPSAPMKGQMAFEIPPEQLGLL